MSTTVSCDAAADRQAPGSAAHGPAEDLAPPRPTGSLPGEFRPRGRSHRCGACGFAVAAWREGFSCFQTPNGQRHYFYCPDGVDRDPQQLAEEARKKSGLGMLDWMRQSHLRCEHQYVCTSCRTVSLIDEVYDPSACPDCGSAKIVRTWNLGDDGCPCCGGPLHTEVLV